MPDPTSAASTSSGGTAGSVELVVHEHGRQGADRDPVVVLHGLFGSGRNWMSIARRLEDRFHVLAPDLRNHGSSPWAEPMTYPAMAADVGRLISARADGPVTLVGHSMGGKAAMILALAEPRLVRRLMVVDVAPVTYPSSFLAYAQAMRAVRLDGVTRRSEVDQQLAETVPVAGVRAFLLQNLVLEPGGARWRVNLPVLERAMSTISGFPAMPSGTSYDGRVLFVAGSQSGYLHPSQQPRVQPLFPRAKATVVLGAGHWVHSEKPEEFLRVLERFLSEP